MNNQKLLSIKFILVTKNQFKNYFDFVKTMNITTEYIYEKMLDLGYGEEDYLMFKGIPIVTEVKDNNMVLRDFRNLSETDIGEWKREFYKIPTKELLNIESVVGGVVIF